MLISVQGRDPFSGRMIRSKMIDGVYRTITPDTITTKCLTSLEDLAQNQAMQDESGGGPSRAPVADSESETVSKG